MLSVQISCDSVFTVAVENAAQLSKPHSCKGSCSAEPPDGTAVLAYQIQLSCRGESLNYSQCSLLQLFQSAPSIFYLLSAIAVCCVEVV